jgi:hypothetical protein
MENITIYWGDNREEDIYFTQDLISENGDILETADYIINLETRIAHPKGGEQPYYFYSFHRDI